MQNATHRLTLAVALAALAVASLALGTQFATAQGSPPRFGPNGAGANAVSLSGIPSVVSYQGRVLNGGSPLNGSGFFKFAIVNASGSTSFWSNDGSSVAGSEPGAGVPLSLTKPRSSATPSMKTITSTSPTSPSPRCARSSYP